MTFKSSLRSTCNVINIFYIKKNYKKRFSKAILTLFFTLIFFHHHVALGAPHRGKLHIVSAVFIQIGKMNGAQSYKLQKWHDLSWLDLKKI